MIVFIAATPWSPSAQVPDYQRSVSYNGRGTQFVHLQRQPQHKFSLHVIYTRITDAGVQEFSATVVALWSEAYKTMIAQSDIPASELEQFLKSPPEPFWRMNRPIIERVMHRGQKDLVYGSKRLLCVLMPRFADPIGGSLTLRLLCPIGTSLGDPVGLGRNQLSASSLGMKPSSAMSLRE